MINKLQDFMPTLMAQYPSGMKVQQLLTERMFGVDAGMALVGNGAAELINILGGLLKGSMALHVPAFNEYRRCFRQCDIRVIDAGDSDWRLSVPALMDAAVQCDAVALISPDNPSGDMLSEQEMLTLAETCEAHGTRLIVDESFVDFADADKRYTMLTNERLAAYPHMIVIKSVSKSYGVPGLRLGVLATADTELLAEIRTALPVWNINSMGEYFMQIFPLFASSYRTACNRIAEERAVLTDALRALDVMDIWPSQANYLLCRLHDGLTAGELTERLLAEYNILIKDLSTKDGFRGQQFIRLAVRDRDDNMALVEAIRRVAREGQCHG